MTFAVALAAFPRHPLLVPMSTDEAVAILDDYLDHKADYERMRLDSISDLSRALACANAADSLGLIEQLGNAYCLFNADSALHYYDLGLKVALARGARDYVIAFTMHKASRLPLTGAIRESVDLYSSLEPRLLSPCQRRTYYEAGNRLFLFAESFYTVDSLRSKYHRYAVDATDSLLLYEPAGSPRYLFYEAQAARNHGDTARARAGWRTVLETVSPDNNLYARSAAELAALTAAMPDYSRSEHLYWLVMAAIGDAAAGVRETTALQSVGTAMYEAGELGRAYRYLNLSQEDAINSGARIRTLQVAEALPIISRTYANMAKRDHSNLMRAVWLLGAALLALTAVIIINLLQRRKMRVYEKHLKQNLAVKDDYISRILNLCSSYIERLEEFNRMAGRKIKAGQVSELYAMIESGKMLQEQTRKFHELFDAAFVKAYPDFVSEINRLMQPDRQLATGPDGAYTPELRLLAFMRLGITDSPQLARFLGLSLNTVYTYRNKLKNRAIDREDFERQVRELSL